MADLNDLYHRIGTDWAKLGHGVNAAAVHQQCRRLSACIKAGGDHFEFEDCFCRAMIASCAALAVRRCLCVRHVREFRQNE